MADLSAAAHPGSGHLLGHVLGDGQAFSMAAHHVGSPKCAWWRRFLLFDRVSQDFFLPFLQPISVLFGLCVDYRLQTGRARRDPLAPYRSLH